MIIRKRPDQNKKIKLTDILRRKKSNLLRWSAETGIQTYDQLVRYCTTMGAKPPTLEEWNAVKPISVTVQTEGIVHIDVVPVTIIKENTGEIETLEVEEVEKVEIEWTTVADELKETADVPHRSTKTRSRRSNNTPLSDND